jgi:hypothetical protein
MTKRLVIFLLLGLVLLTSCGVICAVSLVERLPILMGIVGAPWPQTNGTGVGDLSITIWTSHHSVQVGQPLQIRFTARNRGHQTVIYQTQNRAIMDIIVAGFQVGGLAWSDGKPLTPELTRLELQPGQEKTLEMTWVPDARYERVVVHVGGYLWFGPEDWQYGDTGLTVTVGFVP